MPTKRTDPPLGHRDGDLRKSFRGRFMIRSSTRIVSCARRAIGDS